MLKGRSPELDLIQAVSKNPSIAKFFIQLGRVDELGSGVLNVTRFTKQFSGKRKSEFVEGNVFKIIIPVPTVLMGD